MAYRENQVQTRLHSILGGTLEARTPVGRIDLLTNTELIEIKAAIHWKEAIGQLLTYSHYHPKHKKRLHLFSATDKNLVNTIKEHCTRLGILLSIEPESLSSESKNLSSNIILKKSKPKKHNWQIHSKLIPSVIYHWCTWGAEPDPILPNWHVDIDTDPYCIYIKSFNLSKKTVKEWENWLKLECNLN